MNELDIQVSTLSDVNKVTQLIVTSLDMASAQLKYVWHQLILCLIRYQLTQADFMRTSYGDDVLN